MNEIVHKENLEAIPNEEVKRVSIDKLTNLNHVIIN